LLLVALAQLQITFAAMGVNDPVRSSLGIHG
jgi:hypothetical protein